MYNAQSYLKYYVQEYVKVLTTSINYHNVAYSILLVVCFLSAKSWNRGVHSAAFGYLSNWCMFEVTSACQVQVFLHGYVMHSTALIFTKFVVDICLCL